MRVMGYTGVVVLLGVLIFLSGCAREEAEKSVAGAGVSRAVAVLHPTEGNTVRGMVWFTQEEEGVRVVAEVTGLSPGKHGFHIHEFGDCSDPQAKSAGGHLNPTHMPHGSPTAAKHHLGDLGNLEADEKGEAYLERVYPFLNLDGPHSIVGHAVIVHEKEDDLTSQPTGAAGARLACGVIGIAQSQ